MQSTWRKLSVVAAAVLTIGFGGTVAAQELKPVKFTLDWKFEGPSAPFFVAVDKGYFKEEGLDVTIDTGNGSREAIPRVATGAYEMGFGDINALVKFLDEQPDSKVAAVFMGYDRPPFAVIGRKSQGVTEDPKSLEGKTLGAPPPDAAFGQWGAFKKVAGIDDSAIRIENVGFPVREPMLAQGKVDAIFGFAFSSVLNLKQQGVAADDISVIMMGANGLDLYGNAVIANTDWAAANPDAVKGFLRALAKGYRDTLASPEEAVKSVLSRNEIADPATELERLRMALSDNIATDWVKANGVGGIDDARLATSIEQLKSSFDLKNPPPPARLFDKQYLPDDAGRKIGG